MANRLQSPTTPFFLGTNDDQLERAKARAAARAASVRRLVSLTSQPPHTPLKSCLSKEQIIDLFQNCIKLASENKINQKNTWELKLIDHLSEIIKVEAAEGDTETNFQKASCTLEAGVKIYSARVDSVHTEAYQVLAGINRAGRDDQRENITGGGDVYNGQEHIHSRNESDKKISPTSMLEPSFETLNVKKFDVAFAVDPLYHQTSAQFDEGGAKGLLLNNLGVYEGCHVLFDSFEVPGKCKSGFVQNSTLDMIDLSFARESLEQMVMNMAGKVEISPTLKEIIHHFDDTNQRSSQSFETGQSYDVRSDEFDANEPALDNSCDNHEAWSHDEDETVINESSSFDHIFPARDEEIDPYSEFDRDADNRLVNITLNLFRGLGFTSKNNTWAGPDHWKYKKIKDVPENRLSTCDKRPKNDQAEGDIDFEKYLDREIFNIFAPPKYMKSLLLPSRKMPNSNTLPEDCHYQPESLVNLFLLPNVLCFSKKGRELAADKPQHQTSDFGVTSPLWDNRSVVSGQFDSGDVYDDVENLDGLVSQPRQVNKIEVSYEKTCKKVDVHILKKTLWDHIQEPFMRDNLSFKHVLSTLSVDCRAAAVEDISPHLCFICLLHLANEHGFTIHGSTDLDDFTVHLST